MKINKETIQKLNPLFQAIAEGKTIQVESGDDWMDIDFGGEGVNASTLITCAPNATASSQKQSTVLLRTQKSAGRRCQNINRLGG